MKKLFLLIGVVTWYIIPLFNLSSQPLYQSVKLTLSPDSISLELPFLIRCEIDNPQTDLYIGLYHSKDFSILSKDRFRINKNLKGTETVNFQVKLNSGNFLKDKIQSTTYFVVISKYPFGDDIKLSEIVKEGTIFVRDFKERYKEFKSFRNARYIQSTDTTEIEGVYCDTCGPSIQDNIDTTHIEYMFNNIKMQDSPSPRNSSARNSMTSDQNPKATTASYTVASSIDVKYYQNVCKYKTPDGTAVPIRNFYVEIVGTNNPSSTYGDRLYAIPYDELPQTGWSITVAVDPTYYRYTKFIIYPFSTFCYPYAIPVGWNGNGDPLTLDYFYFQSDRWHEVVDPNADGKQTFQVSDKTHENTTNYARAFWMQEQIRLAHQFVYDQTTPNNDLTKTCLFYNKDNTTIDVSKATSSLMCGPQVLVIAYDAWQSKKTIIHEYGHSVMSKIGASIPDAGGAHVFGHKYNQGLAFSEGWASFFAAAVDNDPDISTIVDISLNPPYKPSFEDPIHYYNYPTPFEGVKDEVMVASMLWRLYKAPSSSGNYDYINDALSTTVLSGHKPHNIMEFIRRHLYYYNVTNGTGYWNDAGQYLRIGYGISFVDPGQSIQTAINNASDKYLIYVSEGSSGSEAIYNEDIRIDSKTLGIYGYSPKLTKIKSPNNLTTNSVVINNQADEFCVLNGFTIENGKLGVEVYPSSKGYISNNIIQNNKNGVCNAYGKIELVNNFIISNSSIGFLLPPSNQNASNENRIYNNHFQNNGAAAIYFYNNTVDAYGYVANNIMVYNGKGIAATAPGYVNPHIQFKGHRVIVWVKS